MAQRKPIFIVEIPEHAHRMQEMRVSSITSVFMKGIPKEEYHVVVLPTMNLEWRFNQFDDKNISQTEIDELRRKADEILERFDK